MFCNASLPSSCKKRIALAFAIELLSTGHWSQGYGSEASGCKVISCLFIYSNIQYIQRNHVQIILNRSFHYKPSILGYPHDYGHLRIPKEHLDPVSPSPHLVCRPALPAETSKTRPQTASLRQSKTFRQMGNLM